MSILRVAPMRFQTDEGVALATRLEAAGYKRVTGTAGVTRLSRTYRPRMTAYASIRQDGLVLAAGMAAIQLARLLLSWCEDGASILPIGVAAAIDAVLAKQGAG